jgi:NAD(P)H-dependent flavin oxidoreductase YrpB (nitropropane dioxygenase family)
VLAEEVGFDGLVANGNEVGGSVSKTTSFILAQELRGRVRIPYWIRGGVGPRVAAAVIMAGAKGWVLAEQLWLSEEGPWFVNGKKKLRTSTAANLSYWGATTTFSACRRDMEEARSRKSNLSAHAARIGVVS